MQFVSVDIEKAQPSNLIIQIGASSWDTNAKKNPIKTCNIYIDQEVDWTFPLENGEPLEKLFPAGYRDKWNANKVKPALGLTFFWDWLKKNPCGKKIIQWGGGDMRTIALQSKDEGVVVMPYSEFDIKKTYQLFYRPAMKLPKKGGLRSAYTSITGKEMYYQHCALEDSIYAGVVGCTMYKDIEAYRAISDICIKHSPIWINTK